MHKWMLRPPRVGFSTEPFYLIYIICNCKGGVRKGYQPFLFLFGMSSDNNFNVENWLQVSHLGSNILCSLQCNISVTWKEKALKLFKFLQQQLTASLGCYVNTKHGGNSFKVLPLRVLRKIICDYNWYYFVMEAITFLEERNAERSSGTITPWVRWGTVRAARRELTYVFPFHGDFFPRNSIIFPFILPLEQNLVCLL